MSDKPKCTLCNYQQVSEKEPKLVIDANHHTDTIYSDCPNCGEFLISTSNWSLINEHKKKESIFSTLSGLARELTDTGSRLDLELTDLNDVLVNPLIPHSPTEKLNKMLLWFHRNTQFFG